MDRLIYTAMTGAKQAFVQQSGVANNLANASTIGFRAMEHKFRAVPIQGEGAPTRAFVVDASVADVFDQGPLMATGRPLDVAVQGSGWIVVETPDGSEAFTRAGNLQINTNGQLQTPGGLNVQGEGGPIAIPPDNSITIATDGTISTVPLYGAPNNVSVVGRIKLVNPPENELVRGDDGLFRMRSGASTKKPVVTANQFVFRRIDQLDTPDNRDVIRCAIERNGRNRAIGSDRDAIVRRNGNRTTLPLYIQATWSLQLSIGVDLQVSCSGVRLAPIGSYHRNPAGTLNRHIEWTTGGHQRPLVEDIGYRGIRHKSPRWSTLSMNGHRAELVFHCAVSDGRGIGQIVCNPCLLNERLFGARHCGVDQAIHAALSSFGLSRINVD